MNEQIARHKEEGNRKTREIAQLRKEQRKQSNAIKSLQTQSAVKDQVLKRRIEEVAALKRDRKSNLSAKAAGRVVQKRNLFNEKTARHKWESMQRTINRAARMKQTLFELERELERLVSEREALSSELTGIKRRRNIDDTPELASEEDTIRSSLQFVQENITQVQHSIVALEDSRQATNATLNVQNILDNVHSFEEAKYLLERLTSSSILQTCETALTQNRLIDNEALLNDVRAFFICVVSLHLISLFILITDQTRKQYATSTSATCACPKSLGRLPRGLGATASSIETFGYSNHI